MANIVAVETDEFFVVFLALGPRLLYMHRWAEPNLFSHLLKPIIIISPFFPLTTIKRKTKERNGRSGKTAVQDVV